MLADGVGWVLAHGHLLEEGRPGARPARVVGPAEAVVVVEDPDERVRRVHGLEVEVGPVAVVLAAIVLERDLRCVGVVATGHGDVVGRPAS